MHTEQKIYINNDLDIVVARMQVREMAKHLGFGTADQARISLAASELARLLVGSANSQAGEIVIFQATRNGHAGMQVVCQIPYQSLADDMGVETSAETCQQKHSLSGACHLVDESLVEPYDDKSTRVTLTKWLP
jgi:serine/threonine-protein kinase RsbT